MNGGTAKTTHPDGEAEVDAPEHGADEAEEPETKLLTTRDLAVLESCVQTCVFKSSICLCMH